MKKLITLLIIAVMMLAVTACVGDEIAYTEESAQQMQESNTNPSSSLAPPPQSLLPTEAPPPPLKMGESLARKAQSSPHDIPLCFNMPTIEGQYNIHVRHFEWAQNSLPGSGIWRGRLMGEGWDYYAQERELVQRQPDMLHHRRQGGTCPVFLAQNSYDIRVISSYAELKPDPNEYTAPIFNSNFFERIRGLEEYTESFFYNNYLVVIRLCSHAGIEMVYRVKDDGTILLRPRLGGNGRDSAVARSWAIVIEVDNRFQPPEFNVEFVCNPWGPSCPMAIFDLQLPPDLLYDGYIFRITHGAVVSSFENTSIRVIFGPHRILTASTLQEIADFVAPEYIMYIEPNILIPHPMAPSPPREALPIPTPTPTITERGKAPDFNFPTVESEYPFQVRYLSRSRSHTQFIMGEERFLYVEELAWVQRVPQGMDRNQQGMGASAHAWRSSTARVITTAEELAKPCLTEYDDYFFEHSYLVVIELLITHSSLFELVCTVTQDGDIIIRHAMTSRLFHGSPTYWTIIIELDNRFQPPLFRMEFIDYDGWELVF